MYGFRDIIEFKCTEDKNKTYVDRIGDICVYDNGKIGYWCDIYPELPRAGEVPHSLYSERGVLIKLDFLTILYLKPDFCSIIIFSFKLKI